MNHWPLWEWLLVACAFGVAGYCWQRLGKARDKPAPSPGPIEGARESQQHFKEHGRWPDAVVDERIAALDADLAAIRERAKTIRTPEDRDAFLRDMIK